MIDPEALQQLNRWAHRETAEATAHVAHPQMQRGAVFFYAFNASLQPGHRAPGLSENRKDRPVIIMDPDPIARLARKLDLHGIPLTSSPDQGIKLPINMPQGEKYALATHAATLNPDHLLTFMRVISDAEMSTVSAGLSELLTYHAPAGLRGPLDPGTMHAYRWKDRPEQHGVLLTDHHNKFRGTPALVLPVDSLSMAEHVQSPPKPRPVSTQELSEKTCIGKISLGALKRNQSAVRQAFGLSS